jgi:type III restriction enzyme
VLNEKKQDALDYFDFQKSRGHETTLNEYCRDTWDFLNDENQLPTSVDAEGTVRKIPYLPRTDGLGRPTPNVCLKIPTGGGKTLLAAATVERLQLDYLKRQSGLVLWVVPSDAIYRQTWKQLANREHPYRQMLERASGGRVKLLEKSDSFTKADVSGQLCLMLLMLPSANRQTKETLRMFRDSGKFPSFFPDEDDIEANGNLMESVRNLDINDLADQGWQDGVIPGMLSIKQSLGNVLRLTRPVIIIDEGHRAYSDNARDTLSGFNPEFVLELSATPNARGRHHSNILVNVPGMALKDEEMIKLPINVVNDEQGDWKQALTLAHARLDELQVDAESLLAEKGRYIRPIMLIRVERTGKGQRESGFIHSEDVREFLVQKLGVKEEEVRLKTSDTDELGDDDLMLDTSPVRYIVTKDALREGWDCPFAYVLVALSTTTASTALTQMVGRVLRQPHAKVTGLASLDECYVFTFDQIVQEAIESIRKGLQGEGMGDLSYGVRGEVGSGENSAFTKREIVHRRDKFLSLPPVYLPRVLHQDSNSENKWRVLDYDRDILGELNWDSFSFRRASDWNFETVQNASRTTASVDISGDAQQFTHATEQIPVDLSEQHVDISFLVRQLVDVVPNPWQGMRILTDVLAEFENRGASREQIYANRLSLLVDIKRDIGAQVSEAAEQLFKQKLKSGIISLRLVTSTNAQLNWRLAETIEMEISDTDKKLRRKNGEDLERSLFEKVFERELGPELERPTAWIVDSATSVHWWHRIAVGTTSYGIQGWQRMRVYPDFLVSLDEGGNGARSLALLETKGQHLHRNEDTEYKHKLFELLSGSAESAFEAGEMQLETGTQTITFSMIMQDDLQQSLIKAGVHSKVSTTPK